jgi:hypothetical protein
MITPNNAKETVDVMIRATRVDYDASYIATCSIAADGKGHSFGGQGYTDRQFAEQVLFHVKRTGRVPQYTFECREIRDSQILPSSEVQAHLEALLADEFLNMQAAHRAKRGKY